MLEEDLTVKFMNNECCVALHYLQEESFRLTITSLEDEHIKTISINLEMQFEEDTFEQ